ncbi:MAG TPA: FecR family protein [Burkholderiales bacterium]|nr:FecR family protein [Burkholderiales bacterium]
MFKNRPLQFSLAAAVMVLASQAAQAATAGHVDFATAGVSAVAANGQSRSISKGSDLLTGETIDTGEGRAQLRFSDGGMISLQPQTRFSLESYGYDKDDSTKNSVIMKLFKGGLRSITGLIGKTNRQGYKLVTATATVGIRGTEFSVNQSADGSILFHCADGVIDVTNQAGSAVISGGQSARVTSATSAPSKTDEKPFLPPGSATPGIALPNNPTQDANAVVPLLTGTFTGEWRVGTDDNHVFGPGGGAPPVFIVGPDGTLRSFSDAGTPTVLGAAHAFSDGNDGVMAWGRWIGGPAPGVGYNTSGNVFSASNPLHYVVGQPLANMPTSGTATFNSYGNTVPTCSGGACGSISVSSSLSINFGSNSGSYSLTTRNSGDGLNVQATGTLGLTAGGNFSGGGGAVSGGYGGSTTGGSSLDGFLAGSGASHAGAIYSLNYVSGPSQQTTISGALVFRR